MFSNQPLLLPEALPSDHVGGVHSCHLVLKTMVKMIRIVIRIIIRIMINMIIMFMMTKLLVCT